MFLFYCVEFSTALRNGLCNHDRRWRRADGEGRGDSHAPSIWLGEHQQTRVIGLFTHTTCDFDLWLRAWKNVFINICKKKCTEVIVRFSALNIFSGCFYLLMKRMRFYASVVRRWSVRTCERHWTRFFTEQENSQTSMLTTQVLQLVQRRKI